MSTFEPDARPHRGRVAVITGAAQGIGRAIAIELGRGGARLALVDRDPVDETVARVEKEGGTAAGFVCDITAPDDIDRVRGAILDRFGRTDILVNNAGIYPVAAWHEVTYELWRDVMAVNLDGACLACKAFGPPMEEAGWGRIVNITTAGVGMGVTHFSHYIASKMGLIGLTRALASEYGPLGITVNAVAPGLVRTPTTTERQTAPGGMSSEEEFDLLLDMQSVKQGLGPHDIAGTVSFLAGPAAGCITGQTIYVDGGIVRGG